MQQLSCRLCHRRHRAHFSRFIRFIHFYFYYLRIVHGPGSNPTTPIYSHPFRRYFISFRFVDGAFNGSQCVCSTRGRTSRTYLYFPIQFSTYSFLPNVPRHVWSPSTLCFIEFHALLRLATAMDLHPQMFFNKMKRNIYLLLF